jgi:hypothetical protein
MALYKGVLSKSLNPGFAGVFDFVSPENISLQLYGRTKEAVMNELPDILAMQGKLLKWDTVLKEDEALANL